MAFLHVMSVPYRCFVTFRKLNCDVLGACSFSITPDGFQLQLKLPTGQGSSLFLSLLRQAIYPNGHFSTHASTKLNSCSDVACCCIGTDYKIPQGKSLSLLLLVFFPPKSKASYPLLVLKAFEFLLGHIKA